MVNNNLICEICDNANIPSMEWEVHEDHGEEFVICWKCTHALEWVIRKLCKEPELKRAIKNMLLTEVLI